MGGRKITAALTGETLERSMWKGCLQRDILLPHSCKARLYMNSQWDSAMAVIHWRRHYSHQHKIPNHSFTTSSEGFWYGATKPWENSVINPFTNVQHLISILRNHITCTNSVSRNLNFFQSAELLSPWTTALQKKLEYFWSTIVHTVSSLILFYSAFSFVHYMFIDPYKAYAHWI
jgi:hypothetical protein